MNQENRGPFCPLAENRSEWGSLSYYGADRNHKVGQPRRGFGPEFRMTTRANTTRSIGEEIFLALFLHVPLAMAVGTFIGAVLRLFVGRVLGFRTQLPDLGVFNPLLWGSSLFLGALINRRTHHRSAYWVAGVGCSYLLAVFLSDVSGFAHSEYYRGVSGGHYLRYEYRLLFSPACEGDKCLGQLLVTLPFVNSIAYSVGAWLGLRAARASENPPDALPPPVQ